MDATVARGFTPIDMDKGFVLSLFHGFRKCVPEATRKLIVREEGEVLQYLLAVRPRLMPFSHRHPLSLRHPAVSMMSRHYFSLLRVIKGGTHRSKRSSHSGSTVLELPGITSNLAESNVRHGQLSLLLETKTIKAEKLCSHNWDCVDFCYKLLLSESPFASMALERLLFDGRLVDVIQRYWDRITCPLMEFESGAPVEGGLHDEAHSPPSSGSGGPRRAFYMTPTQYAYLHMRFAQILLPPGALEAEILDSILADLRIDGRYPQHSLYCSNTQMDSRLSRVSQAVDVLMDPQQYLSPRTQSPNLGSSMLDEAPEAKAVSPHPSKPHDALMALPDVSFAQFFYSMIEFADNWTSTTHPSEYVTFLVELYCEVFGHDWDDDDPAFKRAYQSSARSTVKEGLDNEESQQIDSAEELLADYGKLLSSLKPGKVKASQSLVVPEFGDELGHRGSDDTDLFDLTLSASVRGLSSGEQGGSKDGSRYAAGRLAGRGREENERSEESEEYDAAGGPGTSLRAKHSKRSSRDRHGHRSRRHRRSSSKDASPSPSGTSKVRHGSGAAKESAGLGLSESGRHGSMRRESARVGGRMLSDDGVLYGRRDDFEDSQGSFEYFMDEEEVAVQAEGKISEKDTEAAAAAKMKRPRRDRASKMGGEGHEGSGAKATSIDSRGPKGSRKDRDRHATTEYGALSPHFGGDNSQSLISGDESLTTSMSSQSGTPTYGSGLEPIRRGRHLRALRKGHRSSRQSPDGFSDSGSRLGTPDFRRKTDARLPFHGTAQKMKGRRARGSPSSTTADSQDDQPIGDYGGSGAGRSPHRGKFLYDGEWLTPEEIKYRERAIRYGRSPRSYKSSLSPGGESDLGAVPARTSSLGRHVGGEHTGADGDTLGYPAGVVQPEEDWGSENFDESQKGQVVDKYVLNRNRHPSYERHRVAAETLNSHRDAIMRRLLAKGIVIPRDALSDDDVLNLIEDNLQPELIQRLMQLTQAFSDELDCSDLLAALLSEGMGTHVVGRSVESSVLEALRRKQRRPVETAYMRYMRERRERAALEQMTTEGKQLAVDQVIGDKSSSSEVRSTLFPTIPESQRPQHKIPIRKPTAFAGGLPKLRRSVLPTPRLNSAYLDGVDDFDLVINMRTPVPIHPIPPFFPGRTSTQRLPLLPRPRPRLAPLPMSVRRLVLTDYYGGNPAAKVREHSMRRMTLFFRGVRVPRPIIGRAPLAPLSSTAGGTYHQLAALRVLFQRRRRLHRRLRRQLRETEEEALLNTPRYVPVKLFSLTAKTSLTEAMRECLMRYINDKAYLDVLHGRIPN